MVDSSLDEELAFVGGKLKAIREVQGFSQRELAKRAGITHSNISMIEQGQVSPSIQSLTRILSALNISLSDFFNNNPPCRPSIYQFAPQESFAFAVSEEFSIDEVRFAGDSSGRKCLFIGVDRAASTPLMSVGRISRLGVVLSGDVSLRCLGGEFSLTKGDVFNLSDGDFFCFRHVGNGIARVCLY